MTQRFYLKKAGGAGDVVAVTNLAGGTVRFDKNSAWAPHSAWLAPLLLACVLAVWFGYELGTRALWSPDEGRYAEIPREMLASGDYLTPRLNGVKYFEKPPLVYWLTAASIKVFGLTERALRLWPALFALLGCLAVYVVGLRLYGVRAGVFAAAVLASSGLYDFMGGALTPDMPLAGLLTAAMGAFLLGVRAPPNARRRLWFYGFYAAVGLAVLAKGLIGIVIPAMVIGTWIAVLGEWRLLRAIHLPSGILILLAIAAPWHLLVSEANPEFAQFYFIHEHLERYLTTIHQRYKPGWYFLAVLLAGMYPWSALLPSVLRAALSGLWRERRQRREAWFLLLWALLPLAFFSVSNSKLAPYILPVLPPLALLLGDWLARAWERSRRPPRSVLWLLLAVGVAVSATWTMLPQLLPNIEKVESVAAQLGWAYYAIAVALLLGGVLPFASQRWGGRAVLIALCASTTLLVATLDLTLSRLDVGRSVKELALALDIKPGDEVMTYNDYYQDLPVYLQRRITVVNWTGELEFGARVEDTRAWMIDTPTLRRRWPESRTIYLFTSPVNYTELRAALPGPMCLLRSTQRAAVIVNRECPA